MRRQTTALRICIQCNETLGIQQWPWSGTAFTKTHGLCRPCFLALEQAVAEEDEDDYLVPAGFAPASAH
ncbi:MAG: hypothetical protein QNK04_16420 [Myxococcota bacterium]|nr:hypothetical protein [Myxococcota bacterium]